MDERRGKGWIKGRRVIKQSLYPLQGVSAYLIYVMFLKIELVQF